MHLYSKVSSPEFNEPFSLLRALPIWVVAMTNSCWILPLDCYLVGFFVLSMILYRWAVASPLVNVKSFNYHQVS